MAKIKAPSELQKIASNTVSRGWTLLNLTVSGGTKLASLKIGDVFRSQEERDRHLADFMTNQATILAEELGKLKGSIMKAGQMLSVYGEHFLPEEVNKVLKTLQYQSRPVVWEEMERVLRRQLGDERLSELDIDRQPIAAASMGQVYRAVERRTGIVIALKVQYPGVDKAIDSDLKALRSILAVTKLVPMSDSFEDIFKEIRMMLHYEADYARELTIMKDYHERLADDPRFIVPTVFERYSGKRVLAMSFEEGLQVDSNSVLEISQERRNRIGCAILDLMFTEIFSWRMVQTDPHLGNYKVKLRSGDETIDKIVLLDFGAVRQFPKRYIEPFRELVEAALSGSEEAITQAGCQLGFLRENDSDTVVQLFAKICCLAVEGFSEEYSSPGVDGSDAGDHPYDWKNAGLLKKLSALAKDAVFAFKFRTPPREAIFLDRKMVGTYIFATVIGMKYGPRRLIRSHMSE